MQLLLFRHGIAEPAAPGQRDHDRALTREGVERTGQAARGLARIIDPPDAILTSPKKRAVQTAALVGNALNLDPETVEVLSEGPADPIIRMLANRRESSLLLVGHEPWMSELAERLCAPRESVGFIDLKKAACALVEAPLRTDEGNGRGVLRWLIPPRVLRALGE